MDIEFWRDYNVEELSGMELHRNGYLAVATIDGEFVGSIPDFFRHIRELEKTDSIKSVSQFWHNRFVLTKPYSLP